MVTLDEYIIAVLEDLQDNLMVLDREEIYDIIDFVLELMTEDDLYD